MSNRWCKKCEANLALTSFGLCGECTVIALAPDTAYEVAMLRALVVKLEEERDRECIWTYVAGPYQRFPAYKTGCGKVEPVQTSTIYRPCWCGGKVKIK